MIHIYPAFDGRQPILDIDLGLGREYGYTDLATRVSVTDGEPATGILCGHPDRPYYSSNKCQPCYSRDYSAARKLAAAKAVA